MTSSRINKLEDVVGGEVLECSTEQLIASGENYGSLILKVDVKVKKNDKVEIINAVAKMVPPDEKTQEYFNTEKTFRSEIAFYKNILPTLQKFQKENGITNVVDFFPRYYGSRLNLKCDESRIDSNGIILLENLKSQDYVNLERTEGFNLEVATLIIKDLAQFHAVPVAMRLKKEQQFNNDILPHLCPWRFHEGITSATRMHLSNVIDTIPEIQPLKERIIKTFDLKVTPPKPNQFFDTIIHNDLWVNNIMVKFDGITPIKEKILDFQDALYGSATKDLIFFLFSSVQTNVLEKNYERLVKLYHDAFISTLMSLKCDIEDFSFETLEDEMKHEARYSQFGHLMFMLYPIFGQHGRALDLFELLENGPSELQKKKLVFIIKEFSKKNWI